MHALFLDYLSSFEGTSYKNPKDRATSSFISCCFTLAFTSAVIIFHKFLELHSTLSARKIFVTNFPFLFYRIHSNPPPL